MSQIQEQLEGLPGYDILVGLWDDYAGEHFNSTDPFEDENGKKRKLPPGATKKEQKLWKRVQASAWRHDKCFMGSCLVGLDCGLGYAPIVVLLFPVLGPLIMYAVHARLIHMVTNEMRLPAKLVAKMESQIMFDLIITFPPVIGSFFGWLNACSTRNAGMIYKYFAFLAEQREKNQGSAPTYLGTGHLREPERSQPPPSRSRNYFGGRDGTKQSNVAVQGQQEAGFV